MNDSQTRKIPARQSGDRATSKHDVNLRKNNVVYFQIGLILALLVAILILEIKSPVNEYRDEPLQEMATLSIDDWDQAFVKEVQKKDVPEIKETSEFLPPEVVDDLTPETLKVPDFNVPDVPEKSIGVEDLLPVPEKEVETFNVMGVEVVPVFPGCEGLNSNAERKACLQEKLNSFIGRNFDTSLGEEYGLSGMNKVDVQFTIDEFGNVVNLKTRAPHPALKKEAERVMSKLPQMEPGKQQGKNVRVIYYQPIKFKVQN